MQKVWKQSSKAKLTRATIRTNYSDMSLLLNSFFTQKFQANTRTRQEDDESQYSFERFNVDRLLFTDFAASI
jgi:hypothetical protein